MWFFKKKHKPGPFPFFYWSPETAVKLPLTARGLGGTLEH